MSFLQMSPLAPCSRTECITFQNTTSPECPYSPVHVHAEKTGKDEHIKQACYVNSEVFKTSVKEKNIIE